MKANMHEIAHLSPGVQVSHQNQSATVRKHPKKKKLEDKEIKGVI